MTHREPGDATGEFGGLMNLNLFAGLELLDVLWVLFMLFREDEVLKLLGFQAFKQRSTIEQRTFHKQIAI